MTDNEDDGVVAEAPLAEDVVAIDDQPRIAMMTQEQLWKAAQEYHEDMAEKIQMPGDMIGVCAIMLTNMLIGGVMSGAGMSFINHMLSLIRDDVENGVKHLEATMSTIQ